MDNNEIKETPTDELRTCIMILTEEQYKLLRTNSVSLSQDLVDLGAELKYDKKRYRISGLPAWAVLKIQQFFEENL